MGSFQTMSQKILILEDDIEQNSIITQSIQANYPFWKLCSAYNLESAQKLIKQSVTDKEYFSLFLLDIQLSKVKENRGGFIVAELIRSISNYYQTPILFMTALREDSMYALSHFHCYNYITKPYTMEQLLSQLEHMQITGYLHKEVEICDTSRILHPILIDEIELIESSSHTLTLHIKDYGIIQTREYNMTSIFKILDCNFLQCHRKYIVNKKYILSIDKKNMYVNIKNHTIPIGRAYSDVFQNT